MAEVFTIDTFSSHVGTKFLMHYGDSQTAEIELISVTDLGSTPRQMQFSLIFLGPPETPGGQGIYRIEHDALGAMDIFLVAIGRDKSGVQYEAIFNRVFE